MPTPPPAAAAADAHDATYEAVLEHGLAGVELADDGSAIVIAACGPGPLSVGDAVETLNGHPRPPQLRAAQFAAAVSQQPLPVRLGLLRRPAPPAAAADAHDAMYEAVL